MLEVHTWTASHVVPATATKVAARMRSRRTVAACSANMLRAKRLVRDAGNSSLFYDAR